MTVQHIHTQADVRKLAKSIDGIRLALVYTPRLRNAASWVSQTSGLVLEDTFAQPTLLV